MKNVESDLALLEKNQKEAEQKCAVDVKRLEGLKKTEASLESKLASCKYSNAEQRQQISRSRDVLSQCRRELVVTRDSGRKSHDAIKAFDGWLKKALWATRVNGEIKRKIQAQINCVTVPKLDRMTQIRNKALKIPMRLEKERDQVKHKLTQLRHEISAAAKESSKYSEEVAKARSDMGALEQELANAQHMEATTSTHAQGLEQEIEASLKAHTEGMEATSQKIQQVSKEKEARKARGSEMQSTIDKVKQQVNALRDRLNQLQGDKTTASIESTLQKEDEALSLACKEKLALLESIKSLKTNETELQKQEESARLEIRDTVKATQLERTLQADRRKGMEKVVAELDEANQELQELEKAYSDLTDNRVRSRTQSNTDTTALQEAIETQTKQVAALRDQVSAQQLSINRLNEEWPEEKVKKEAELDNLKRDAEVAQNALNSAKADVEIAMSTEEHHPKKLEQIERTKAAKAEVAALLKGMFRWKGFTMCVYDACALLHQILLVLSTTIYFVLAEHPELGCVSYEYDRDLSFDTQCRESLKPLTTYCRDRVTAIQTNSTKILESERARKAEKDAARDRKLAKQTEENKRIEAERRAAIEKEKERDTKKERKPKAATATQPGKEKPGRADAATKMEKRQETADVPIDTVDVTDFTQPDYEPLATPKQKKERSPFQSRSTSKRVHWKEASVDESIAEPESQPEPESQTLEPRNRDRKSKPHRRQFKSKWEQPRKASSGADRRGSRDSKSNRDRSKSENRSSKGVGQRQKKEVHDGGVLALAGTYPPTKGSSKGSTKKSEPTYEGKGPKGGSSASDLKGGRKRTSENSVRKKSTSLPSARDDQPKSTNQQSKTNKNHRLSLSSMLSGKSSHSSQPQAKQDVTKKLNRRSSNAKGSGSGRTPLSSKSSNSSSKKSSSLSKKRSLGKTSTKPIPRKKKKLNMKGLSKKSLGSDVDFKF